MRGKTGFLENFVDEGAIFVYLVPITYIAHVQTTAEISDVKFVVVKELKMMNYEC